MKYINRRDCCSIQVFICLDSNCCFLLFHSKQISTTWCTIYTYDSSAIWADDDSFHSKPISFYLTLFPSYSLFHSPPQPTPIYFQNLSFHRLKEQITMMEQLNRRDTHTHTHTHTHKTHTHKTHTHHDSCFKEFGKDFCTTACDCWLGYSREYSKSWVTVESVLKNQTLSVLVPCMVFVLLPKVSKQCNSSSFGFISPAKAHWFCTQLFIKFNIFPHKSN